MARSDGSNAALLGLGRLITFLLVLGTVGAAVAVVAGTSSTDDATSDPRKPRAGRAVDAGPGHRPADPAFDAEGRHEPPPVAPRTYVVEHVVDGDTLDLGNGETVRLVGIDSPDFGECGFEEAAENLREMVEGESVTLTVSDEDTDQYGRLLRYVDLGSVDAGYQQIRGGYAVARYDSRDGFGLHARQGDYIRADRATPDVGCP